MGKRTSFPRIRDGYEPAKELTIEAIKSTMAKVVVLRVHD